MNVKINKEALLKHRFWIMLGCAVALALGGMFYLEVYGDEEITKDRNKLTASWTRLKSAKAGSTDAAIKKLAEKVKEAKGEEAKVWSESYRKQEDLFEFPPEMETAYEFHKGRFANDIIVANDTGAKSWPADTPNLFHGTYVEHDADWLKVKDRKGNIVKFYRTTNVEKIHLADTKKNVPFEKITANLDKKMLIINYQIGKYFNDTLTQNEKNLFNDSYIKQIPRIMEIVNPLDDKNRGIVQLREWLYHKDATPDTVDQAFIRYVTDLPWKVNLDITKEAWIAQEDLWIQKDIYRMIREANKDVSHFKPTSNAKAKTQTFQNSYFDLDLSLDAEKKLTFKIKNRLSRRQSIDLTFRVKMSKDADNPAEIIKISGAALLPKGDKAGKDSHEQFLKQEKQERTGIYDVEQVLTWQTAAVKRIDQIAIGSNADGDISHSHRTFPDGLIPADEADKGVAGNKLGAPKGLKGRVKGGAAIKPVVPGALTQQQGVNAGGLDHGLWRDRYIEISEQSRRIPVAIVLIADQEHVDRVLTAFNNSRLRFLQTQVLLNQYSGSMQPPAPQKDDNAPPPIPVKGSKFKGFGPRPVGPPVDVGGASDMDTNIEMVIYGIMTVYQRYPARPAFEKRQ